MIHDMYLQVLKIAISLYFLYLTVRAIYSWPRTELLYIISVAAIALATFWSFLSVSFFTDQAAFVNSLLIALIEATAVSYLIFTQVKYWDGSKRMRTVSDSDLVIQFVEGANKHVRSAETRDPRDVEESKIGLEEMRDAYFEIERRDPTLSALRKLLTNENDAVRMWAARRLLDKYEKESLAALDDMAKGDNYSALKSREIADAWRKGELKM